MQINRENFGRLEGQRSTTVSLHSALFYVANSKLCCRSENRSARHGYMGHLVNIANLIAHLCSVNSLGQFLNEHLPEVYERFQKFKDTTLQEINKTQETLLVSFAFFSLSSGLLSFWF